MGRGRDRYKVVHSILHTYSILNRNCKVPVRIMPPSPEIIMMDDESPPSVHEKQLNTSAVDVERGAVGTKTRGGMYLRWARITKDVEIKEGNR